MPSLIGGIVGASSRLSGGLSAVGPVMVSDVQPTPLQVTSKSLGQRVGKQTWAFYGITKDSAGAALAACTVDLFRTSDDMKVGTAVSDGAGNYEVYSYDAGPFYVVAYKAGAPDVAGTTVNTLTGA
jgi:hypothetical protein